MNNYPDLDILISKFVLKTLNQKDNPIIYSTKKIHFVSNNNKENIKKFGATDENKLSSNISYLTAYFLDGKYFFR